MNRQWRGDATGGAVHGKSAQFHPQPPFPRFRFFRHARGTSTQGIGRSGGGLTSKIVAVTDALGYLVRFVLLPGQAHDLAGMLDLL